LGKQVQTCTRIASRRIDVAVDTGAKGVVYDHNGGDQRAEVYQDI